MGLRNIVIRRETVQVDDSQSFTVRGITLFDIMQAVGDFGPQMALAFGKMTSREGTGPLTPDDVKAHIRDLAKEFPDVLAAAIAMASDDYSKAAMDVTKQLPMSVQLDAIEKVARLSFRSEAEVGKLMESLVRAVAGATGALTKVELPLPTGTGDFADS